MTTDGGHDGPIFPNLAKGLVPTGPDQLWVADPTPIRGLTGFVPLAVTLDAPARPPRAGLLTRAPFGDG